MSDMENRKPHGVGAGEIAVGTAVAAEVGFLAADILLSAELTKRPVTTQPRVTANAKVIGDEIIHSITRFSGLSWKDRITAGAVAAGAGLGYVGKPSSRAQS